VKVIVTPSNKVGPVGKNKARSLSPFTAEIIRSYLISTVREMVEATVRTAYSTCFSEGLDFSCALFDRRARMIAQEYGLPVHSGALLDAMETIVSSYGSFQEGDVVVHNDPYTGGTHQMDVVIARPVFFERKMLGFAVNRGHWTDVGGMSPGGWSGTVRHVIQEALIIPPVKLYKAGVLDREIRDFILKNIRVPKQCWGDLQAQIASDILAERRMRELARKYGLETVLEGMEEALRYSRRRFTRALEEQLPNGTWEGTEYQEDDGHGGGPYKVHVTLTKQGHRVLVDFAGTDPQVRGPVNCSFVSTKAACYSAIVAVVDPDVPFNSGFLELIEVKAPVGCLVHAVYPAPVLAGPADPGNKVYEAVLKSIGQIAPGRITGGSYCTANNCVGSGVEPESDEDFLWYIFESGGCGARATKDGLSAMWHTMSNCKNQSMEIWETRYPLRFEKYEMVTDSGGPGKHRGGLGTRRQMRLLLPTYVSAIADRHQIPPWGLAGGKPGMPNKFSLIREGKEWDFPRLFGTRSPAKFSLVPLKADDVYCVTQGGGGGYGDPLERDLRPVEWDILNGYVSLEKARDEYGVWIDPLTGKVDAARTTQLRQRLAREGRNANA
jgi:N-methylhydantoinase B/oxoprolinase/acetone carboxylase alpha subunit